MTRAGFPWLDPNVPCPPGDELVGESLRSNEWVSPGVDTRRRHPCGRLTLFAPNVPLCPGD